MPMLSRIASCWRSIFAKRQSDRDLDDEVRAYAELLAGDKLRDGMTPEEARRSARIEMGGIEHVKEDVREARAGAWLDSLLQDLRYGVRMLRKDPGFTATAVLTLALGIGVNTSVFSLIYSLAIRPFSVKDPGNIVSVYEEFRGHYSRGVYGNPNLLSYPEYAEYRDRSQAFNGLAAYAPASLSLRGSKTAAISGLLVSCNYFDVLADGFGPGRPFAPEDCQPSGASALAVISDAFWQSHFGGNPAVLGRKLALNRGVFTIVGVAAKNFKGTEMQPPDVWIPLAMAPLVMPDEFHTYDWLSLTNVSWLNVVGRLKPAISHKRAEAELAVLVHRFDSDYPGRQTLVIVNSGAYLNNPEIRTKGAWVAAAILAIAAFVLIIACVNLMNLLLARASTRFQEMGIRMALGASRLRLVRQLLSESILLAVFGGLAGLLVAVWLPPILIRGLPEMPVSPQVDLHPNFTILAYAFLTSLAAALMCGLEPAMQSTELRLATGRSAGGPFAHTSRYARLRNLLSSAQVAGCAMLLIAAGLLVRGLHRAESASPGFLTKNIVVVSTDLSNNGYTASRARIFNRELRDRLLALPGVVGVAQSAVLPCVTGDLEGVTLPDRNRSETSELIWANFVSSDYFQTMGISLLRGRVFTEREAQTSGPVPAVISVAMAQRFWPNSDPLGKLFRDPKTTYQVTGIAPDVQNSHLGQTDGPFFYGAELADTALDAKIFVRTSPHTPAIDPLVRELVGQLDPNVMPTTESFEQVLETILAPPRTVALLIAILGLLAMILAVVGVSGVIAYAASQRTHEIGVRMALGAHPQDIMAMFLRQGAKVAAIGLAIGLALGAAASQLLYAASILFGVSSLDPPTYLTTAIVLASVTMIACYVPARHATRVDPMIALRHE
jgi:macrolide transport system ATP-binding/permease protein